MYLYELSLFSGTIFDVMMVFKDTELDHYLYKGGLSVLRLYGLDKAHRLSINIVILILSSDTVSIQYKFNTNSEAAMLSTMDCLLLQVRTLHVARKSGGTLAPHSGRP